MEHVEEKAKMLDAQQDAGSATETQATLEGDAVIPVESTTTTATVATSPTVDSNLLVVDDNELVLLTSSKLDKAVCTNDTLEDLQRALTYEAVFSSLLEKKVLAMKRDCEERKRAKRMKRKSLGRIFFAKKLFGSSSSRKSSICGKPESDSGSQGTPESLTRRTLSRTRASESQVITLPHTFRTAKPKPKKTRSADEIEAVSTSTQRLPEMSRSKTRTDTATAHKPDLRRHTQAADESVASTLSNSSEKYSNGAPIVKRNLLVRAQTHTHAADSMTGAAVSTSSSGDSKDAVATLRRSHRSNGNGAALSASLPYDTASLPSAYENALGSGLAEDRIHTSTMADDSLTSIRDDDDSIESLSFASSRYTVSFGGTEIIPEDTASLLYERERERARLAKRLRILEAKSISAQCSPIFPRHITKADTVVCAPTSRQVPTAVVATIATAEALRVKTPSPQLPAQAQTSEAQTQTQIQIQASKKPFLPNQVSYTDSLHYGAGGVGDLDAAYLRYFSRQNTSEDSANLTVSTLLNQSDSLSLHLPPSYASSAISGVQPYGATANLFDRYKSKSTSLLVVTSNGRSRPPPALQMTLTSPTELPTAQLAQLQITSNISRNLETHLVDSLSKTQTQTQTQTHKRQPVAMAMTLTEPTNGIESPTPQLNITTVSSTLQYYHPVITSCSSTTIAAPAHATASTAMTAQTISTPLLSSKMVASTYRNGNGASAAIAANGAIVTSSHVHDETAKLNRMTSTSTGSSVAPTGCCTTMKSSSRDKEKEKERQQYQHFKPSLQAGQGGSDDEYRRRKRKYKRYHRCSDPVLVYPTPSGLQHCILSIPPSDPVQFSYGGDFAYDMRIQMDSDKIVVDALDDDDLEEIVPSSSRRHRRHRHHRHKKRHRHKKPKILVQDLETQVVKVIDPDDLPQRARWTIIATACLLLIMCLMLVGVTLRMAPIIDDMENVAVLLMLSFYCFIMQISAADNVKDLYTNPNFVAQKLFTNTASSPSENIIFSPLSIESALVALFFGATGETEKELRTALGLGNIEPESIAKEFENTILTPFHNIKNDSDVQLRMVTRIYVQEGHRISPKYNEMVSRAFQSKAEAINFGDSANAVQKINNFVEEQTQHKIKNLLSEDSVSPLTNAVLINAIYFKGAWESQFDASYTKKSNFLNGNSTAQVDMMHGIKMVDHGTIEDLDAKVLRLPYANSNLSMLIFLPNTVDGLVSMEEKLLSKSVLHQPIGPELKHEAVAISIPKFRIEYEIDLKKALEGVLNISLSQYATYTNMFETIEDNSIGQAKHKAFIEVNEAGTEAAAATKIDLISRMAHPEFRADHPFAFYIVDPTSVYFAGHVVKF